LSDFFVVTYIVPEGCHPDSPKTIKEIVMTQATIVVQSRDHLIKIIKASPLDADLNHLDVSRVTDMSFLFAGDMFVGDISQWDVSNVTDMRFMFFRSHFNGVISDWNVSNVKDASYMFYKSRFNRSIKNWDVTNLVNAECMFAHSKFDKSIRLWDLTHLPLLGGKSMFKDCPLSHKPAKQPMFHPSF